MKKILVLVFSLMLGACASPKSYMAQQDLGESLTHVKRIGVTIPTAVVKELGFGGAATDDPEASQEAKKVMEQAVVEGLKKGGLEAQLIDNRDDLQIFQKGYQPLSRELKNHFPGAQAPATLPSKIDNFKSVLQHNKVDCVLAVEGLEHVSSAGRKAAQVVTAILFGQTSKGMTYLYYNLFCGEDGKPLFADSRVGTGFSISSRGDVAGIVEDITTRMVTVAKAKD
jgi:hypothetical protein